MLNNISVFKERTELGMAACNPRTWVWSRDRGTASSCYDADPETDSVKAAGHRAHMWNFI